MRQVWGLVVFGANGVWSKTPPEDLDPEVGTLAHLGSFKHHLHRPPRMSNIGMILEICGEQI